METKVSSATKEVIIDYNGPTTLIGERINPSGKKKLAEALKTGDFNVVRQEAIAQVDAGADKEVLVDGDGSNETDNHGRNHHVQVAAGLERPFRRAVDRGSCDQKRSEYA